MHGCWNALNLSVFASWTIAQMKINIRYVDFVQETRNQPQRREWFTHKINEPGCRI